MVLHAVESESERKTRPYCWCIDLGRTSARLQIVHLANHNDSQCPIPECLYSHAGNWAAAEQLAFRALALGTQV